MLKWGKIRLWRTDIALLVMGVMVIVSVLVSPFPLRSLVYGAPMILGMMLYAWLTHQDLSEHVLQSIVWGFAFSGLALSLLACVTFPFPPEMLLGRLQTSLGSNRQLALRLNENVIAGALVVVWPFSLGLALIRRREVLWWQRLLAFLSAIAVLTVLWTIPARGAHAALMLAAGVWIALGCRLPVRWTLVILMILVVIGIGVGRWPNALALIVDQTLLLAARQRIEIWQRAISTIRSFPFSGVGMGNFEAWIRYAQPLLLLDEPTVTHAHNLYLQVAVDLGLPGTMAYLYLLANSLVQGLDSQRKRRAPARCEHRDFMVMGVVSLVGTVLHGLVDSATWGNKGAFLPWLIMGVVVSLRHKQSNRGHSETS